MTASGAANARRGAAVGLESLGWPCALGSPVMSAPQAGQQMIEEEALGKAFDGALMQRLWHCVRPIAGARCSRSRWSRRLSRSR